MDRRVRVIVDVLRSNPSGRLSIKKLAALSQLSESHLEHLFRRDAHMSIRAFTMDVRLGLAAHLIETTDERIQQICFAAGFSDAANFNHVFRRRYGMSPRGYRVLHDSEAATDGAAPESQIQPRKN
jgi:AraC family transcriptional regulator, arabinose operon regulatory protein